jgi:hypothetical protein
MLNTRAVSFFLSPFTKRSEDFTETWIRLIASKNDLELRKKPGRGAKRGNLYAPLPIVNILDIF